MKKIISVLIIILSVTFVLAGCFEVKPTSSGDVNIQTEPEVVSNDTFHGYSFDEWKKMVKDYYGKYANDVICKFDEKNNFTVDVASKYEVFAQFVFDDETGYAKDINSGLEIDFINGKTINVIKNIDTMFTDNICLGIASITDENEEATINKYCSNRASFDSITRLVLDNGTEYIDKFLIIPKDENVTFDIYSVKLTDEGTIEPEFEVDKDMNNPILFTCDDYESTMPHYGIKLKANGFEDFIPLSFSGYDGSLALSGHESEVIDLTIYE